VNPDRAKRNPLLVLASVNTLNAYNSWGGYSRDGNIGEDFTYCRAKSDDESQHPR